MQENNFCEFLMRRFVGQQIPDLLHPATFFIALSAGNSEFEHSF
jgi:hypothetical protein